MDFDSEPGHYRDDLSADLEIARIMQHGFDADQAKAALSICSNNSERAVKLLVQQRAEQNRISSNQRPSRPSRTTPAMPQINNSRKARPIQPRRPERPRKMSESSDDECNYSVRSEDSIANSAEKFISAANEISNSMWTQASGWFQKGRQKVQEYQDSLSGQRRPSSGYSSKRYEESHSSTNLYISYRDYSSSDEEIYVSSNRRRHLDNSPSSKLKRPPTSASFEPLSSRFRDDDDDGLADKNVHSMSSYGKTTRSKEKRPTSITPDADIIGFGNETPTKFSNRRVGSNPTPASTSISIHNRPTLKKVLSPQLSTSALTASAKAKTDANEKFKLGQYAGAVEGYNQAISYIGESSSHPYLIVLFNNAALCQTKNGEAKAAIEHCTRAIQLCERYASNGVENLATIGESIDFASQHIKALQRRAGAKESIERFRDALNDWDLITKSGSDPQTISQARAGIVRCQKALDPPVNCVPKKPPKPQQTAFKSSFSPQATASELMNVDNSAGVAKIREKEKLRAAEETEQFAQYDSVESEISVWKDGKQQNLRALLSSLHMVIPEWKMVGMHELIEPQKVKRAYMRAIAKTHPDKLSKDIDIRKRMIASSVFGTLNEAWDIFKSQNNLS